jgi:hypothetical protein
MGTLTQGRAGVKSVVSNRCIRKSPTVAGCLRKRAPNEINTHYRLVKLSPNVFRRITQCSTVSQCSNVLLPKCAPCFFGMGFFCLDLRSTISTLLFFLQYIFFFWVFWCDDTMVNCFPITTVFFICFSVMFLFVSSMLIAAGTIFISMTKLIILTSASCITFDKKVFVSGWMSAYLIKLL